jgi:hypothetical protein
LDPEATQRCQARLAECKQACGANERISQPSLAANLLYVAAADGQNRIAEAFRLLLRAAARCESGDTVPLEKGEKQVEE